MTPERLHKVIKQFIRDEGGTNLYRLGRCSEFAVALKKFVGSGTITKHGTWHTVLYWKNIYWDANGQHTLNNLKSTNYISAAENPHPATKEEIDHINSLLNKYFVDHILAGLRKASREV